MAGYATVSREEAAKQQQEIKPPTPPGAVEVGEAPESAAPGSHPAAPVESDTEALAQWQGQDLIEATVPSTGSWKLNAFGKPVWIPDPRPAGGGTPSRSTHGEIPETKEEREARLREEQRPAPTGGSKRG